MNKRCYHKRIRYKNLIKEIKEIKITNLKQNISVRIKKQKNKKTYTKILNSIFAIKT